MVWEHRDADREGDRTQLPARVLDAFVAHLQAYLLDPPRHSRRVAAGENEQELFPAVAKRQVLVADASSQEGAECSQHLIARIVAERVVHPLEVVDVDHREDDLVATSPSTAQLALDEIREVPS